MPNPRMKQRRVVHKSTAGILKPIPEAVDLVGNPPPGLTTKTVALLHQRGTANRRSRSYPRRGEFPAAETVISAGQITFAPPTRHCEPPLFGFASGLGPRTSRSGGEVKSQWVLFPRDQIGSQGSPVEICRRGE